MNAELPDLDIDAILGDAKSARKSGEKRRALSAHAVSIAVTVGQNVPKGTVLVELTPATD